MPKYSDPPKKRGRPPLPKDKNSKASTSQKNKSVASSYVCTSCGSEYTELQGNFMTSSSRLFYGLGGYVLICRECLAKYYTNTVLPECGDDEYKAAEYICGLFDWYYDPRLVDMASDLAAANREKGGNKPMIIFYGERRTMQQYQKAGLTYLDKCKQRWEAKHASEMEPEPAEDEHVPIDERDISLFGPGYSADEYNYMRSEFDEWKERYNCETKAQEEIFKNIVIAQLNVRRSQQESEQEKTNKAMKSLNELMASAKIQPKQKADTALVDQNTFGTLIQKWENEEPIPVVDPELADVDGIKKYISTWFYGHLCKMFKLDNDMSRMYDEEISQYTVEPPRYRGDDDDVADDAVSQQLKAMRGKSGNEDEPEGGDE